MTPYEILVLCEPMTDGIAEKTGERVRQAMIRARVRQNDVAAVLGISQAQVSQRLAGNVDFSVTELAAIARHLGVPMVDLIPPVGVSTC